MSIHQKTYDTLDLSEEEAARIIGVPEHSVESKRQRMKAFLKDHEWDLQEFINWIPEYNRYIFLNKPKNKQIVKKTEPSLPSVGTMAKNLLTSAKDILMSGVATVSEEEQNRRFDICQTCNAFIQGSGRCSACGCFMKLKTAYLAMECKLGKW